MSVSQKGQGSARGAIVTVSAQAFRFAVQILSLAVLARLLGPDAYGLVAIVVAIVGFGEVLRDLGLSMAAVQAESISEAERSNLFWVNTFIGGTLAALLCACSGVIAHVFDDGRLTLIACALAVTFVANGAAAQYRAGLNRDQRFTALASADVVAQIVGLVVGVTIAAVTGSYWALVAQQLLQALTTLSVLVWNGRWRPRAYDRRTNIRRFLHFGAFLTATQVMGYASRNVDTLVIGQRFGTIPLGYYNRAFQFMSIPVNQLNAPSTAVTLPRLSRARDQQTFDRLIVDAQRIMITCLCLLFAFMASQADAIIQIILGDGWGRVPAILQILAVAGMLQSASYATYWAFLAKGATRSNFVFSLISRPIVIGLVFGGSIFGVRGVAAGYVAGLFVTWILGLVWIARGLSVDSLSMFWSGARAIVSTAIPAIVAYLTTDALHLTAVVELTLGAVCFGAVYGVIVIAVPAVRRDVAAVVMFLRQGARRSRNVRG